MKIIDLLRRLRKKNTNGELNALIKKGLTIGDNVRIYSDYPFDSLYPWLITVGNNVTITPNVKILAKCNREGKGANEGSLEGYIRICCGKVV